METRGSEAAAQLLARQRCPLVKALVAFAAARKQKALNCRSRTGNWNQRNRNGMKMRKKERETVLWKPAQAYNLL